MKSLMPQIDSNDGLFHNGNPATGEQGTRVTDTWLNNLQDRVRDVQAEVHYVLQKAGFKPVENKQTQLYEAIVKIIDDNRKTASLTQKGETKLYTGYDSQSEDLALTPKTGYQLKQLIDSNTRSLGNVIPNSKKSSVVNSNSNDTLATSAAVKTAYDKAVSAEENNLYQKIYVGKDNLQLDLTDRQQLINLFGYSYRINGHLSFTAHNNAQSNITGLPLTTKSPIAVTFYIIGGYSSVYCHYPLLGRSFFSRINFNNTALTYKWIELLTNTGEQTINNQLVLATRGWSKIKFPIDSGGVWRVEMNPNSETDPRFNFVYKMKDNTSRYCSFPVLRKNEVVAYQDWVNAQIADNFTRGKLTTQNLNDIKAYGIYAQEANRDATPERNYPTNFAGTLIVYPSAYNVMQKYINFRSGETYQRNVNIDLRTWSEWRRIDGLNSVSRSGDKMTGSLMIEGSAPGGFANGLMLKNKAGGQNTGVFVDFYQTDNIPRASMLMRDAGNNSTQIEFLNTPEGADWYRDSRQGVLTISSTGGLWSKSYGWLHDHFAKQDDIRNVWNELNNTYRKNRYRHQYYPHHYNSAEVFDIPMADNGVMRVIIMNVTINGYAKVNLPEAFNGSCVVQATDVGGGQKRVGANIQNGNVVEIHNSGQTDFQILAIGWYGW
ncbi:pyocin knob domain-containing protein [Haemophilus influenzae]|uniref:pyocin knob domain-containing protein n=3 Tax=Haemophilus influenzae TaxID=727 RepID=UPI0010C3589B|nr:pyocin knob domain-containing protein [Haemophilus influenzae]VTP78754.1 tail fiber protein [Haemophilus influenzae]